jgi:exopolysaccharide production protein ExoZ
VNDSIKFEFNWLQALRGLAALAVCVFHAKDMLPGFLSPNSIFSDLVSNGKYGVDFFFVLSGFVITLSILRGRKPVKLSNFIATRLRRIFVGYWPILALTLGYQSIFHNYAVSFDCWQSIFLMCSQLEKNWIFVAWSLTYELMFYVIFGAGLLMISSSRVQNTFLVFCWFSALLFNLCFWLNGSPIVETMTLSPWKMLCSGYTIEFLGGAIVATRFDRTTVKLHLTWATGLAFFILGCTATLILDIQPQSSAMRAISWGFIALGTLIGLLKLDLAGVSPPTTLVILGNASYIIYLLHPVCIDYFASFGMGVNDDLLVQVRNFFLAVASSVLIGCFWHSRVEHPMMRLLTFPRNEK